MYDRTRRFSEACSEWFDVLADGGASTDLEEYLTHEYRAVWQAGDADVRGDVLNFLIRAAPVGGVDIVWAAVDSSDKSLASLAFAAATRYVQTHGVPLDSRQVRLLKAEVDSSDHPAIRVMALGVLEAADPEGLDAWLNSVAERDTSDGVRLRANIMLMRHGSRKATEAILADLRKNLGHFGVAIDLWEARDNAGLSDDERRELRSMLARYVARQHGNLRNPQGDPYRRLRSGRRLAGWMREGFPVDTDVVETVYDVTVAAAKPAVRIAGVDVLAAFDLPSARERIEEIARTDEAPEVREHARRVLAARG
jgi:hypothetical protein